MGFGKVPSTRRVLLLRRKPRGENFPPWFFFFVTHLKQLLVASSPALHSPSYNSIPGQLSEDFFSRVDVPRGHSNGYLVSSGAHLHCSERRVTRGNKVTIDMLSAYLRGSTFLPNVPPNPIALLNWYQA